MVHTQSHKIAIRAVVQSQKKGAITYSAEEIVLILFVSSPHFSYYYYFDCFLVFQSIVT